MAKGHVSQSLPLFVRNNHTTVKKKQKINIYSLILWTTTSVKIFDHLLFALCSANRPLATLALTDELGQSAPAYTHASQQSVNEASGRVVLVNDGTVKRFGAVQVEP